MITREMQEEREYEQHGSGGNSGREKQKEKGAKE